MAELNITLLLFAELAEACGTNSLATTCAAGTSIESLLTQLAEAHPHIAVPIAV